MAFHDQYEDAPLHQFIIVTSILLLLSACNLQSAQAPLSSSDIEKNQSPTNIANTDSDNWEIIDEGLSWQTFTPDNNSFAQMAVLRIDPTIYKFQAVYQAGNPAYLSGWQANLPDAVALINANFFDPNNNALGIIISDGIRFGSPFRNTGGTFIVENGIPSIRSNQQPPDDSDGIEQAIEGFPMLVENSQSIYFNNRQTQPTRRTLIAQDNDGHILIFATPFLGLSLAELSEYLPTSGLNIVTALNLDGGGSTMMSIRPIDYNISAFDPVPAILAIYPR